eukprot:7386327-Prymnesium_polylepis.1
MPDDAQLECIMQPAPFVVRPAERGGLAATSPLGLSQPTTALLLPAHAASTASARRTMLASETVAPSHGRPRNHFASGSMELSMEPAEARAQARISARHLTYQAAVREYQQQCDAEAEQERAAALWRLNKERVLAEGTSFEPGSMALKEGVCFCEYEPCRCKEPSERVFSGPRVLHFKQQAAPVMAPGPGVNDAFGSLAQRRHYPP